jgi:hypothetical protein
LSIEKKEIREEKQEPRIKTKKKLEDLRFELNRSLSAGIL